MFRSLLPTSKESGVAMKFSFPLSALSLVIACSLPTTALSAPNLYIKGSLNFGASLEGQTVQREIELTNDSRQELAIFDLGFNANAIIEPRLPIRIAAGQTQKVSIVFETPLRDLIPSDESFVNNTPSGSAPYHWARIKTEPLANVSMVASQHTRPLHSEALYINKGWLYQNGLYDNQGALFNYSIGNSLHTAVSPNGQNIYMRQTNPGFDRTPGDENILVWGTDINQLNGLKIEQKINSSTLPEGLRDDFTKAKNITVSPNGQKLYVTGSEGSYIFDITRGGNVILSNDQITINDRTTTSAFRGMRSIHFSPDGQEMYGHDDRALMVFDSSQANQLTFTHEISRQFIAASSPITVSQDKQFMYTLSLQDRGEQLNIFKRNEAGEFELDDSLMVFERAAGEPGTHGDFSLHLSKDQNRLYFASGFDSGQFIVFERDESGSLTEKQRFPLDLGSKRSAGKLFSFTQSGVNNLGENHLYLAHVNRNVLWHFKESQNGSVDLVKMYQGGNNNLPRLSEIKNLITRDSRGVYLISPNDNHIKYLRLNAEDLLESTGNILSHRIPPIDGLQNASDISINLVGENNEREHILVAAEEDSAVSVFRRSESGDLNLIKVLKHPPNSNQPTNSNNMLAGLEGVNRVIAGKQFAIASSTHSNSIGVFSQPKFNSDPALRWLKTYTSEDGLALNQPQALTFSADEQTIYMLNTQNPVLSILTLSDRGELNQQQRVNTTDDTASAQYFALSHDEQTLAISHDNGTLSIVEKDPEGEWRVTQTLTPTLSDLDSGNTIIPELGALTFSPDNRFLYVSSAPNSDINHQRVFAFERHETLQWQEKSLEIHNKHRFYNYRASDLEISRDGQQLFFIEPKTFCASDRKSNINIYSINPASGELLSQIYKHDQTSADNQPCKSNRNAALALDHDESTLYAASFNNIDYYTQITRPQAQLETRSAVRYGVANSLDIETFYTELSLEDFTVENGELSALTKIDEGYTIALQANSNKNIKISLPSNVFQDDQGIPNQASQIDINVTPSLHAEFTVLDEQNSIMYGETASIRLQLFNAHGFAIGPATPFDPPHFIKENFPWLLTGATLETLTVNLEENFYDLTITPTNNETGIISFTLPDSAISVELFGGESAANLASDVLELTVEARPVPSNSPEPSVSPEPITTPEPTITPEPSSSVEPVPSNSPQPTIPNNNNNASSNNNEDGGGAISLWGLLLSVTFLLIPGLRRSSIKRLKNHA